VRFSTWKLCHTECKTMHTTVDAKFLMLNHSVIVFSSGKRLMVLMVVTVHCTTVIHQYLKDFGVSFKELRFAISDLTNRVYFDSWKT